MADAPLVIPKRDAGTIANLEKQGSITNTFLEKIAMLMGINVTQQQEQQKAVKEEVDEAQENQDQQTNALNRLADNLLPRGLRQMFEKMIKPMYDFVVKSGALRLIGKTLKNVGKAAFNLFFSLMKLFLIMAILDPQGKLLSSILNIFINIAMMFVQIIIKMLPNVLANFINIALNVHL